MSQDTESFNNELYDLLKVRGYKPVPLNSQNKRVGASQQADVMEFTFTKDGEEYGKAWISVDGASKLKVYFDDEQQDSPDTTTPGVDYDDTWTGLLKHLKQWAQRRQLSFELANKDRLGDDMRQRDYYKMKEKLGEGWNPMGKTASYNDAVPSVKIIVKHNRALEEGEQRYRNVARIFLENADGERFLAPTTRPGIARVYARHIAEGGVPNDERWNHIKSICEDYNKMAGFVRATRNGQFNESVQVLVNEGVAHYNNLRETLHKLTGHRGYHTYFESYTPALMEGEGEDLSEMFMSQSLDPRIESAMPILSRLYKPATMNEVDSLAEWADGIISEKLEMDSTTKSLAVPADEMLDEAPGAETLAHNQSTEKANLKAFGLAEEEDDDKPIGKGKIAYTVVDATGKKKVTALADYPDAAKELAATHWGLPNIAGIRATKKEAPTDTSGTSDTSSSSGSAPLNKAQSQVDGKDAGQGDQSTWDRAKQSMKQNWNPPADALANIGKLGAALVGLEENDDEETNVVKIKPRRNIGHSVLAKDFDDEFGHYDDLGRIGKLASINDRAEDDMDWDDDSWIPDVEDFEDEEMAKELSRHRGRFAANDLKEMEKDLYQGRRHDPRKGPQGPDKTAKAIPAKKATKDAGKMLDKAFKGELEEELTPVPSGHKGLNKQQKSVGQVGATEKAKNISPVLGKEPKKHPFQGKLVGASESTEIDPELARIIEMARFKR